MFLIHLGLISTLYNVPEKSKGIVHFPLRSIPVLKVFLIAYVWSSISSFLPAIVGNEQVFTSKNILVFIAHLMFIMSITLPFDIRDFENDTKENLITFPQVIGIWPTKLLSILCIILFTLIIHGFVGGWYMPFFSLVTAILILSASSKRKDYYFTFYLDGTIILYFITLILSLV
jgi:4-hydroxybenzoate polyprenyltransferase